MAEGVAGNVAEPPEVVQAKDKIPAPSLHVKFMAKLVISKECWHRYDGDPQAAPQVNLAQSTAAPNAAWFIDAGASSHITPDLNCLTNYAPYQGNSLFILTMVMT
jgi:hypothetical protein